MKNNNQLEIDKGFFELICNQDEVERIFNPQNSNDYLLKVRAETVIDNDSHLLRTIRNRKQQNPNNWNFTQHFSTKEFDNYIKKLLPKYIKHTSISKGMVFSNDPNAALMRSDYGDIIVVSESLRYFLYFMNLCYVDFDIEVPLHVRQAAQMIAIRTMLKTETMDFEQDPRGIIPENLNQQINLLVDEQLEFIIGHELGHHFCNHLDKSNLIERSLFRPLKNEAQSKVEKFYNRTQQQEFEADIMAIKALNLNKKLKSEFIYNSILFFIYLDVYQIVSEYIFPIKSSAYLTHPSPIDRLWNIFNDLIKYHDIDKEIIYKMIEFANMQKEFLLEHVGFNIEDFEMFGSFYLDKPNSTWRGRELIDRVDYF